MSAYSGFAHAYDFLMKDVDYKKWAINIDKIYKNLGFKPSSVLELGCGTGNITVELFKAGYNIIGSDISEDMLMIAQEKAYESNHMINFILQDMREINYRKKVSSVISICDGINYITDENDLKKVFASVWNVLENDGIFIFDISSYYKLKNVLGCNTFAESYEEASYIWENYFDEEKGILDFDLTVFIREDEEDFDEDYPLYIRHFEQHKQKAHKLEDLKASFEEYFELISVYDGETFSELMDDSQRMLFVCKKK